MGYETHNSILNLGSVFLIVLLYFILLFFMVILMVFNKKTGKGGKCLNYFKLKLIFGFIISATLEPYLEFLISGYLNLMQPLDSENGEVFAVYTGFVIIFASMVILPIILIYVISRDPIEL